MRNPPNPYLIAIAGGKRYGMPNGFNRLLVDNGLKVTDENVIELAEAFVLVAVGEWANGVLSYPQIDFLETKKSKLKPDVWTNDAAVLTVRVGEHMEKWHFDVLRNQFVAAGSKNEEGRRMDYGPVIIDSLPGRGQLVPTPDMVGEASQKGDAQVERDSLGTGLASKSEPEERQEAKVSMRRLSASEVMAILDKFPEMVPSYLASSRNDPNELARIFEFIEVTAAPLARVFPSARFYKGHDFWQPPQPYMMAVAGEKRYMLGDFNQLLLDNGLKVDDKRIIELAEAFVIFAIGDEVSSFPEITFLTSTRAEIKSGRPTEAAKLKVKIGSQTEEWSFSVLRDQFDMVSRSNEKGLIKHYLPNMVKPLPSRGQLDQNPDMAIDTFPSRK